MFMFFKSFQSFQSFQLFLILIVLSILPLSGENHIVYANSGEVPKAAPKLRWFDITTLSKVKGGVSGYQLIVHINTSKLDRLEVFKDDPYWIQFYAKFWNAQGQHIETTLSHRHHDLMKSCQSNSSSLKVFGLDHRRGPQHYNHGDYQSMPLNAIVQCYPKYARYGRIERIFPRIRFLGVIDNPKIKLYPGVSSLGANYRPYKGLGATMNFAMYLGEFHRFSLDGYRPGSGEAGKVPGYWRDIRPGEVTKDGFGIIPLTTNLPREGMQWVFVIPSNRSNIGIAPCKPNIMGCRTLLKEDGKVFLHDPPLWTASEDSLVERLTKNPTPMGNLAMTLKKLITIRKGFTC